MEGSTVRLENVTVYLVKFVKAVIQKEKSQLKLKKLNKNEDYRNWKRDSGCYL